MERTAAASSPGTRHTPRPPRRILPLLAWTAAALAAGACGAWGYARAGGGPGEVARDALVGWTYAAAGLVGWWRRPANGTGRLMLAEGLTWFVGNLQGFGQPLLVGLGAWGEALNLAVLGHLLLAFPEGRVTARRERLVAGAGYVLVLVGGLLRALLYDPAGADAADSTYLLCDGCRRNALLVVRDPGLFTAVDLCYRWAGALLTLCIVVLLAARWRLSSPAYRRLLLPSGVPLALVAAFFGWEVVHVLAPGALRGTELLPVLLSDVAQAAVPVAFLAGLLRTRLRRAVVGNLVIAAGPAPTAHRLQTVLREVLGDPALRLGLPSGRPGSPYADPDGRPLRVTARAGDPRTDGTAGADAYPDVAVTTVGPPAAPAAVLVHDRALCDDPGLMASVAASVALCLHNTRLVRDAGRSTARTRALQARLLRAADEERRRLERMLHDGAQARLVFALMTLSRAAGRPGGEPPLRAAVAEAERTLRTALAELRDLAHGLHPAVLTRGGLGPAVDALAEQASVPVVVMVEPGRLPALTETTAYYVICEALTNAAKHARARAVTVETRRQGDRLVVRVTDDGVGGAGLPAGSGLRKLADRVAAMGGVLRVDSPAGEGTRIRAELPCG
jgi:signal transduction histidine kinase